MLSSVPACHILLSVIGLGILNCDKMVPITTGGTSCGEIYRSSKTI